MGGAVIKRVHTNKWVKGPNTRVRETVSLRFAAALRMLICGVDTCAAIEAIERLYKETWANYAKLTYSFCKVIRLKGKQLLLLSAFARAKREPLPLPHCKTAIHTEDIVDRQMSQSFVF